ncbi:hypothetical protein FHG64_04450 [Antarcticibacterium flavum]|uniref:Uncharacterized protein n=1 Tax=Antarcticibacterium flavum TaxID=2058175 RepID=A0A5B7WZL6_9FLAO|nr:MULTISPECIES: hypothetical protein [Antarcticibacterium]MCM4160220.1 hypothetical protein [Antarcticibacterium sp. W02-3]QCY68704.1 hypothetical protein FHG64_04450 [Antarcticibacterium flavum]
MIEYLIENFLLIYILEFAAAVAGVCFLRMVQDASRAERLLVGYLWLVVLVEMVGLYPLMNYFTDFRAFPFVKGTLFERNYWWYNVYALFKFPILIYYFLLKLESKRLKTVSKILVLFLLTGAFLDLFISQKFFTSYLAFLTICGTLILGIVILLFYYEMLKSSRVLEFYRLPSFYFSAGILLWHLTVTPLFIYNKYFSLKSPEFLELHRTILKLSNIILYSLYITGWIIGIRNRKIKDPEIEKSFTENKKVSSSSKY